MPNRLSSFLSRFSRITTSGRYIPEIDGLRFLAVLHVIIIHIAGWMTHHLSATFASENLSLALPLFRRSELGVLLFFIVSGFILGLPFAQFYLRDGKKVELRSYFLRRFTRIEPPFLINLCLVASALLLFRQYDAGTMLPHFLASILYAHTLIYQEPSTINYVTWSLEYEVQFYLIAPFLAHRLYSVRRTHVRYAIPFLLIPVLAPFQSFFSQTIPWCVISRIAYFVLGMGLADLYCTTRTADLPRTRAWDVVGLVSVALLLGTQYLPQNATLLEIVTPILLCGIVVAGFRGNGFGRFLRLPFVTVVGGMCYTIYLYHSQIMSALIPVTQHLPRLTSFFLPNVLLQFVVLSPIILAICAALFLITEKPFMNPRWPSEFRDAVKAWLTQLRTPVREVKGFNKII